MTLGEYVDAMGILGCNVNPYLPALDDFGFTWSDTTALIDRQELFYCKAYRHRTVYLSPRVYHLLSQCGRRKPLTADAASLLELLETGGSMETEELKKLSLLDPKRYGKAFEFLLEHLYITAIENGRYLSPNWSTLKYGTGEEWNRRAKPQPISTDPEGEARGILSRTLPEGEISKLLAAL